MGCGMCHQKPLLRLGAYQFASRHAQRELSTARHNEERERVSEGAAVTHPIFILNRVHEISNYVISICTK